MKQRVAMVSLFIGFLAVPSQAEPNRWTLSLPGVAAYAVAIDPVDPAIAYAATATGIFKTTNRGAQWSLVEEFPETSAIAVNPRNPANVVAGHRGTLSHVGTSTGHIRMSEDGGATWSGTRLVPYADYVSALAFDPAEPATVYASLIGSGVAKSTDGGKNWIIANNGLLCCAWDFFDTYDIVISTGDSPVLYAASGRGLYKSTDGAALWESSPLTPPGGGPTSIEYFEPLVLAVAPSDRKRLYVSGYQQPHSGPLTITSGDGGLTWESVALPAMWINRIAIDPRFPATLYAASSTHGLELPGRGVLRSSDGGLSSVSFNDGLPVLDVASITVDPSGSLLYASTPEGVFAYEVRGSAARRRIVRK